MKMKLLFCAALLGVAVVGNGQTANNLSVNDTRDNNEGPNTYSHQVRFDFKNRSTIGVPGSGIFGSTMTIAQWGSDGTGGKNHQLHFNDGGIFYRAGVSNSSAWDSWRSIVLTDANGNVGIGTTTPQYKLDIAGSTRINYANPVQNLFQVDDNITYGLVVKQDLNVGIGTNTPRYKLDILSTASADRIQIRSTNNSANVGFMIANSDNTERWSIATVYSLDYLQFFRAGYGNVMILKDNGNVLIGKTTQTNTAYKLDIAGKMRADEITVNTTGADFVFEPTYKLRTLAEVEAFIKASKHLPDVVPAADMQTNGVNMGDMQAKLLQKVEELTLYVIEQDKVKVEQSKQLQEQEQVNAVLQQQLALQAKEIEELKQLLTQKLK